MKKKKYVVTLRISVEAESEEEAKKVFWENAIEDKEWLELIIKKSEM